VIGFSNLLDGSTSAAWKAERAIARAAARHFGGMSHEDGRT
jgi:hypothetical protein